MLGDLVANSAGDFEKGISYHRLAVENEPNNGASWAALVNCRIRHEFLESLLLTNFESLLEDVEHMVATTIETLSESNYELLWVITHFYNICTHTHTIHINTTHTHAHTHRHTSNFYIDDAL